MLAAILSTEEVRQLAAHEAVIEKGWNTFIGVGRALEKIRDDKLYRASHKTFDSYCRMRWQYGRSQAYRLIGAAQVLKNLSPIGDNPAPTNEAQVRPLIGLEPEKAKAVWKKAVEKAGRGKVTARLLKEIVLDQEPKKAYAPKSTANPDAFPSETKVGLLMRIDKALEGDANRKVLSTLLKQAAKLLRNEMPAEKP